MNSFMFRALTVLLLSFSGGLALADRQQDMDRMRKVNQIYQIFLGRSAFPKELRASLARAPRDIAADLTRQKEFQDLFACRLQSFMNGSQVVESTGCTATASAKTDASLPDVLKPLTRKNHGTCGKESQAQCFSLWLLDRVAPLQKEAFLSRNQNSLATVSYAELLNLIANDN